MKTIIIYKNEVPWQMMSGEDDFLAANLAFQPLGKSWMEIVEPIPNTLDECPAYDEEKVTIL